MLDLALRDELSFRPVPPGDADLDPALRLRLRGATVDVDVPAEDFSRIERALAGGILPRVLVTEALAAITSMPSTLREDLLTLTVEPAGGDRMALLATRHRLDEVILAAVETIDRSQTALLNVEPLSEVHFRFSAHAKVALALGWMALSRRGIFPVAPLGAKRLAEAAARPTGPLHFVSASDADAGYLYTMGIALSAEAQARGTMDVSFGLDGELIVPGQAVAPIPPGLAMATRCFAVSIPTSSNISEEVQSIPIRSFAHPTLLDDLAPRRGGRAVSPPQMRDADATLTDLRQQLDRFERSSAAAARRAGFVGPESARIGATPKVAGVLDVSGLTSWQMVHSLGDVLANPAVSTHRERIGLYLNLESSNNDRVARICETIDAATALKLELVLVTDDVEDAWLPNLLEYLEADELNAVADYADKHNVRVLDGRPVDPVYTAATAAQRIQSVFTTLSVDILKMGMWLCLDAMTARLVWSEIARNTHIPANMVLMPIGIIEPWCAFVDNRDETRTARAILDPFEKIKFMIEEAEFLGVPSLLTDTRHKNKWVLLGHKTDADEPHLRERFVVNAEGTRLGRTPDSAIPLLSWQEFMECERLARRAGVLLGQAGSIEVDQAFRIVSETTLDAARDGRNPATAFWTAETERVLRFDRDPTSGDLQSERSSDVEPLLAAINRDFEAHAKLDGWLRYLAETEGGDRALLSALTEHRATVRSLLAECVASRHRSGSAYQDGWDVFQAHFSGYHALIRETFSAIQERVAAQWQRRIA